MHKFFWKRGLTLIEILVVMGVLTVVFGFMLSIGFNFYSGQALISERDSMVNVFRVARSQALNNADEANHGIYIGADQYILFEGDSYAARKQDFDSSFPRAKGLTISGLSEIVFNSLQGDSTASGTITISNSLGTANITVNNEGRIDW